MINAVLAMLFTVVQTVALAHTLGKVEYSATVAMIAVGLYVTPLNQSIARASFLSLRETTLDSNKTRRVAESTLVFNISQTLLMALAFLAPALVSDSLHLYMALVLYTVFIVLNTMWSFEIQMVLIAVGEGLAYERVSIVKRLLNFSALGVLYVTKDFMAVGAILCVTTLVAQAWAVRLMSRKGVLSMREKVTLPRLKAHLATLWTSLVATFGEWATFNGPYAVFTARYGVGAPLVLLDAIMKALRLVLGVTRNVCEVIMSRLSKEIVAGRQRASFLLAGGALGVSVSGALVVAIGVMLFEKPLFDILLGHNNVVPAGAGGPLALAMLAGAIFQVGSMIIGLFARRRLATGFTIATSLVSGLLALAIFVFDASPMTSIWWFAVSLAGSSVVSMAVMLGTLRGGARVSAA